MIQSKRGFPGDAKVVKNPLTNVGDLRDVGLTPGLGRSPGGGHGNPLHYSCLENPHGQRSLKGYSPWGHKESDTTEQLSTHTHMGTEKGVKHRKFAVRTSWLQIPIQCPLWGASLYL